MASPCSFFQPKLINLTSKYSCVNLIKNLSRNCSSKPISNNDVQLFICNRNPRNLERLQLERKPSGYGLDLKYNKFWHRLIYSSHNNFISAKLIHNTHAVVVEASTDEWCIRKFLYSTKDKQAHIILARVFAERCIESGMTIFSCEKPTGNSQNYEAFYKTLEEEGLILNEPKYFDINDIWRKKREKRPWTVLED